MDGIYEKVMENEKDIKEKYYIYTPNGLTAVRITQNNNSSIYYVIKDHIGSVNTLVAANGSIAQETYFDACLSAGVCTEAEGFPRDSRTFEPLQYSVEGLISYGYTSHACPEQSRRNHWDSFGLIYMKGRVYDPALGRFLSPDNYVQNSSDLQSYNRYTYCNNNPLKYTDPSGELLFGSLLFGGLGFGVGMILDYTITKYLVTTQITGQERSWSGLGVAFATDAITVASGGVGSIVSATSGQLVGGIVGGSLSGAGMGLANGVFTGAKLGKTFELTILGGVKGLLLGTLGGTLNGAIGGDWGALTGGAAVGGLGAAMNGGSDEDMLIGATLGGAMAWSMYHLNTRFAYQQYKESGITFDGKTLSYRQFAGISADFQRSEFWGKERGGYLVGKKYIRYPAWTRHKYSVDIPNAYVDEEAWATFHTHWDEPGKRVINNGEPYITSQYHSPDDYKADKSLGISSIVINKYNASYNSQTGRYSMPFNSDFYRHPYSFYYWGY